MREKEQIVDTVSRKLFPYILLFGLYLVSYGHLSPGGGFQGGVVLASGVILLLLSRGSAGAQSLFPMNKMGLAEMICFLLFILMGITGIVSGRGFLGNFLPLGKVGEVPSAGFIFFLNLVIGVKVGAGISLICYYLLKED